MKKSRKQIEKELDAKAETFELTMTDAFMLKGIKRRMAPAALAMIGHYRFKIVEDGKTPRLMHFVLNDPLFEELVDQMKKENPGIKNIDARAKAYGEWSRMETVVDAAQSIKEASHQVN